MYNDSRAVAAVQASCGISTLESLTCGDHFAGMDKRNQPYKHHFL